jgi:quinolinate synthase
MAETASILNPERLVVIPDLNALCPLAAFASGEAVREWRKCYPDYSFVAYVNTTAEVKAEVDICCTSANAVEIVRKIPQKKIVFLPDKNLGAYVRRMVPEKEIVLWPGFCVVHEKADPESILNAKLQHPGSSVLAHPECPAEILDIADAVLSTGQMFDYVERHENISDFIIVTEWGIIYSLNKRFGRNFFEPSRRMECSNMKKITAPKLLKSLETFDFKVEVDPSVAVKALRPIERMLELAQ